MCVGITSHSARAKGATQEAHLFLIAAFCRRDQSLSHWKVSGAGDGNRTHVRILGKLSVQVRYYSGAQKQEVSPPRRPVAHFPKVLHNPLHIFAHILAF